ncbi:hypothetical protein BKA80DRAFT_345092, partial [Phyllosticta citrichinensis]
LTYGSLLPLDLLRPASLVGVCLHCTALHCTAHLEHAPTACRRRHEAARPTNLIALLRCAAVVRTCLVPKQPVQSCLSCYRHRHRHRHPQDTTPRT